MNTMITYSVKKIFMLLLVSTAINFVLLQRGNANTVVWTGAGAGGTNTDLNKPSNWGVTTLSPTDDYVMTLTSTATISQTAALTFRSLTISLASINAIKQTINININYNLVITNLFSIKNISSVQDHEIDFNIVSGATTCGSVETSAGGIGSASPSLYLNMNSNTTFTCNGNWVSSALDNTSVSTYIKNNGALTINGLDSIYNSKLSTVPVHFLTGNLGTTTLNGRVKWGTTKNTDYVLNGLNTVLIGSYTNTAKGQFIFNTNSDSVVLGYNMGTETFNAGTLLFTGTNLAINSYAKQGVSPDRSPGTFQVGTPTIFADVSFTSLGDNSALTVYNLLSINSNSVFTVQAAVIPSDVGNKATIELKAAATMNLGVNQGKSSTLPTNYLKYLFDPTSTINYNGKDQNVYSGANYGNLTLSNTGIKRGGGSITVLGNFLITGSAVFDINDSDFANLNNFTDTIAGNWTNNSTDPSGGLISSGVGKVSLMFNGNTNTIIGGANLPVFYGLKINKSSAVVTMNKDLTVTDSTSFLNGALTINGKTLTLNGVIATTNGTITGSQTSHLVTNGTGTVKFTQSGFSNYLKELTVKSGTLIIGLARSVDTLNIAASNGLVASTFGTVTVNNGGTLIGNSNLTLKSDAFGTAIVGPSYGNITDTVRLERFFPAIRAWRFVAVPFSSTAQTINQAWQEGYTDVVLTCPPQYQGTPGYGTAITFNNTNGYDVHNNNYKTSIQFYQDNKWVTPSSTLTKLVSTSVNNAYSLFVRGDRSVCLNYQAAAKTTTLRPKGILNQKNSGAPVILNFTTTNPNDFILVGNPYAAPVDIKNIMTNASVNIVTTKFWAWNPLLGAPVGTGGYVTVSTATGIAVPNDGTYTAETIIQSGQAFMVQRNTTATSGSLTFNETDKSTTETTTGVFGLQAASKNKVASPAVVYINLLDTSKNIMDGVAEAFSKEYAAKVDSLDASKQWNTEIENMALVRHDTTLAIEFRPIPKLSDTIFLKLYLRQHSYSLQLFAANLPPEMPARAWIIDKYLNTKTEFNVYDTTLYNFTPNTDTNSYRNRFMIVFSRQLSTAPVATSKTKYQIDSNISGISNGIGLSAINNISIQPNPVNSIKNAMLSFDNATKGLYEITLYTMKGQKLASEKLQHDGSMTTYSLPVAMSLSSGIYTVTVFNKTTGEVKNIKLVISK